MKKSEIEVGAVCWDSKWGIRRVEAICHDTGWTTYRTLSALQERQYDWKEGMVEVIGKTDTMTLTSFCSWAKTKLTEAQAETLVLELKSKRIKLSIGETALMASFQPVTDEIEFNSGTAISVQPSERRSAKGLLAKGLLTEFDGEQAIVGELGAAWIRVFNQASPKEWK